MTRDIRGYMVSTQTATTSNIPLSPTQPSKQPHVDKTVQSSIEQFVVTSNTLTASHHHVQQLHYQDSQPQIKKCKTFHLLQPTLHTSFHIDPLTNAHSNSTLPVTASKRDQPPSPDNKIRFKRRRMSSPVSTSTKRTQSILATTRIKKRRIAKIKIKQISQSTGLNNNFVPC